MTTILTRTVRIEAPIPFSDEDAEALVEYVELTIDRSLQAVVDGILDAARSGPASLPLAHAVVASVTE